MKTGTCAKCGIEFYIDSHHIYPKQFFNDETVISLCPNCHREIHAKLPKNKQKKSFYKKFTKEWLAGLIIFLILVTIVLFNVKN